MPRFYCDYCDVYLTHDSFSGRRQHMKGRRHQDNVRAYYMQFLKKEVMQGQETIIMPGMGKVPASIHPSPPGFNPNAPYSTPMIAPGARALNPMMNPMMRPPGMPPGMPPGVGGMMRPPPPMMGMPHGAMGGGMPPMGMPGMMMKPGQMPPPRMPQQGPSAASGVPPTSTVVNQAPMNSAAHQQGQNAALMAAMKGP